MLRQYGRLGIIIATIACFFLIYSLNYIPTSPGQIDQVPPAAPRHGDVLPLEDKIFHDFAQPPRTQLSSSESITATTTSSSSSTSTDSETTSSTKEVITPADNSTAKTTLLGDDFALQQPAATTTSEEPPKETTKIIVMGRMSHEDTDWVAQEMTGWQNAIYYVDLNSTTESPSGLKTKMNKAKETTPYLTYIVDHYPDFPDVMAFIHAHRMGMPQAWHNDAPNYDAVLMLNALRLDTVLERGYVNLRCNNEVGCPDEIQPWRTPHDDEKHAEHAFPYIYANFFNTSFDQMKEQIRVVATQCCAQFAVSKEQMLSKPKSEYERYLRFIEETHYDDDTAGRVLEYMWHIIFGRDAVHCEETFECWCNVYGRCHHGGFGGRMGGTFRHPGV